MDKGSGVKRSNEGQFINFYQKEDEATFEKNARKVRFSDEDYQECRAEIVALRYG